MNNIFVGIEWDLHLENELFKNSDKFDIVEVVPENFFYAEKIQLKHSIDQIKEMKKPIICHGVELSIGSREPLKEKHLEDMMRLFDAFGPINYSDHLCMTEAQGIEIGQLTPLRWSRDLADFISEKIIKVQNKIGMPFLIENITNTFVCPINEITETEFINRVLKNTNCGMLLDVTNVFTNSYNHKFDPIRWIDEIDLSKVAQIHLAGGFYDEDRVLQDTHSEAVFDESWELYEYVIKKIGPVPTIIERTGNIPKINCLIEEAEKARSIQNAAKKFKEIT